MEKMATSQKLYSLLIIFIISINSVKLQECKKIEHTTAVDDHLRTNHLDCTVDLHHEVRIFKAEYRVLRHAGDQPSHDERDNESCLIKGLTTEILHKCHKTTDCIFDGEDFDDYDRDSVDVYPYVCDSYEGDRYVLITWQCRAIFNKDYNAYALDLLDNRTHEITFAAIDSHDLWRWILNYCHPQINPDCAISEEAIKDFVLITEHDQGCSFVIPANTETWVFAREIYKFPPEDEPDYQINECTQRIMVYNDENIWYLCETNDYIRLPCQDTEQTLYLKYETDDVNIRVGFAIYVEVDFEAPKMLSTCGIPTIDLGNPPNVSPNRFTSTTTTTTTGPLRTEPTTTTTPTTTSAPIEPKESSSFDIFDDFPIWVLIVLSIFIAVIFLLVVFTIVYFRHCRKTTGYREDNQSLDAFAVVSNISTSESWADDSTSRTNELSSKDLSLSGDSIKSKKSTKSKTVRFYSCDQDNGEDYMVGGDATYPSLKSDGYDFF